MQDSINILAPAKLNIFLKILGRRDDGFHIIRSGITFINLFDKVDITISNKTSIKYTGHFKPTKDKYENCIILKTLKFLNLKKNFKIIIEKNIPVQGGLGSASTNAAALIEGLQKMQLIKKKQAKEYISLGSDIPCFLFKKNCISTGIGETLFPQKIPKYYFLIVKPTYNNSTKKMYQKLGFKNGSYDKEFFIPQNEIAEEDNGNDFEKIIYNDQKEYSKIIDVLDNLKNVIFTRMTGSGSCVYAAFDKEEYALSGQINFKKYFDKLWTVVSTNNINNI